MTHRQSISIGPELPEFGSWNWLGKWMIETLSPTFDVTTFSDHENPPPTDVVVFLKFKSSTIRLMELQQTSRLVFVPVDVYGNSWEIDSDVVNLRLLSLVILHCQRLTRYFRGVTDFVCLDHPLKYILPEIRSERVDGPLLWIGKKCNLAAVIPYLQEFSQTHDIRLLTDIDQNSCRAEAFGLSDRRTQVGKWSPQRHIEWMATAKAAVDVKGDDFRSRHKPPAKSIDFLASGVPVITNRGSSVDLNLTPRGFSLLDADRWSEDLSVEHQECLSRQAIITRQHFGAEFHSADLVRRVRELVE
jgi:hypothetical protein